MKPGIRSTEFALTVLAVIGLFALAVIDPTLRTEVVYLLGGLVAVYTSGRTIVKAAAANDDT